MIAGAGSSAGDYVLFNSCLPYTIEGALTPVGNRKNGLMRLSFPLYAVKLISIIAFYSLTYYQIDVDLGECVDWRNPKSSALKVYRDGILSRCATVRFSQHLPFGNRAVLLDHVSQADGELEMHSPRI